MNAAVCADAREKVVRSRAPAVITYSGIESHHSCAGASVLRAETAGFDFSGSNAINIYADIEISGAGVANVKSIQ
jgi:hypothetical protein